MFFLKKVNALVLGLAVLLAVGCGKDDEGQNIAVCTIKQFAVYGNIYDFIFDDQHKLIKVNHHYFMDNQSHPHFAIEYNAAGKIAVVRSYNGDGVSFGDSEFFDYNSDGLLSKITLAYANQSPYVRKTFEYNASKQLIKVSDYNLTEVFEYTSYTYLPESRIKEERFCNNANKFISCYVREWTFSSIKNPLNPLGYINENLSQTVLISDYLPAKEDKTVFNYTFSPEGLPLSQSYITNGKESPMATYDYHCQ